MVDPSPLGRRPHAWEQIASRLESAIRSGAYGPGDKLPSESALCETYHVARMTTRHALEHLREEGMIESRPGVGWFVSG